MDWITVIGNLASRIPVERVLFPPPDGTKELERLVAIQKSSATLKEVPPTSKTTPTTEMPEEATASSTPRRERPTTEETIAMLKRKLAKEAYKVEIDLANGLLIAGKPCDCLSDKHSLLFEALVEEAIPLDPRNPIYRKLMDWINAALPKSTFEAIRSGRYNAEYPLMASEMRDFRKGLVGTTSLTAMIEPSTKGNCPICGGPLSKDGCCPKCGTCPIPKPTK